MPSPSPPQSQSGPNALPILAGAVLAAGGYFAARAATDALGYGADAHALRVAALCAPLFIGGIVALWPGRRSVTRVAVLLVAVGLAAAAWAFVPCRPDGPSLAAAAAQRSDLKARLVVQPKFEEIGAAGELREKAYSLAADYPTLSAGLRSDFDSWGDAATKAVAERFAQTPPDDIAAARDTAEKANRLREAFRDTSGKANAVNAAVAEWVGRAVRARSGELLAVEPGDWAGFDRTAAKRRELAEAFGAVLIAEGEWAARTAQQAIAAAEKESPKKRREAFREAEKHLLALAALGDSKTRFLAARQKLFAAAHEAARAEAREHIENRKYGLAYTVAVSHAVDWDGTTQLLTPDERKGVAELRESCRYLARLSEKAGDLSEVAPEPRSKP